MATIICCIIQFDQKIHEESAVNLVQVEYKELSAIMQIISANICTTQTELN